MDSEQRDAGAQQQAVARGGGTALTREQRRAERQVLACFSVSAAAGVGLFVLYFRGGQTQLEGMLWALALGGLGIGIGIWGLKLLGGGEEVEERHELASKPGAEEAFEEALGEEVGPFIRRRSVLVRALVGAGGAIGLALLLPVLSLGPAPGRSLKETGWRRGLRVVDENGTALTLDALPEDGFLTVYPEGAVGRADSQALLIRVPKGLLELPPDRMAAVPEGSYVAYSKLCTHAGCPVGLYRAQQRTLLCPCHQSQFDVLNGAKPFFGPASAPLPQLPLGVDSLGRLVAQGDFYEPVGPAFWDRSKS
ncbi:MAG TPA: Rieske 2Fe-2S domain-containing protein [Actinomycetes bacterium]|nr:Rieske 2Fe-2S domain-containing protein [Actinomycetes bacterium]